MDNSRMSTADMLQYCDEALAWDDFGPIDIFFFQSVKKILLGQCSAIEEPEDVIDDLMGIERPVRDVELEPDYDKYADIYYGEEGDDEIPDYSRTDEDEAFDQAIFSGGFFEEEPEEEEGSAGEAAADAEEAEKPAEDGEADTAAVQAESDVPVQEEKPENNEKAEKKPKTEKQPVKPKKKGNKKQSDKNAESSTDKHEENKDGGFTVNL